MTPRAPTIHHGVLGRVVRNASTGERPDARPSAISAIMMGKQMRNTQPRYTTTNAAPPPWPTFMGKPQMLPSPIADPAAASMNPTRHPQVPRVAVAVPLISRPRGVGLDGVVRRFPRDHDVVRVRLPESRRRDAHHACFGLERPDRAHAAVAHAAAQAPDQLEQ